MTLLFGLGHPKWYVKGYTVFCLIWGIFFYFNFIYIPNPPTGIAFFGVLLIGFVFPLIPLWYLWHKGTEKQKKKEAAAEELGFEVTYEYRETLQDQLTELKEQLGRGVITQEEYEQKKKKLLEEYQAK